MDLRLIREPTMARATLGALYVRDVWTCWTLEDALREVPGQPVETWKIPTETAIPAGRYPLVVTWSQRFQRLLPEIQRVPGFTGIRIHAGNRHPDTEGCILIGFQRATAAIVDSRRMVEALVPHLAAQTEAMWITIENPPSYRAV